MLSAVSLYLTDLCFLIEYFSLELFFEYRNTESVYFSGLIWNHVEVIIKVQSGWWECEQKPYEEQTLWKFHDGHFAE